MPLETWEGAPAPASCAPRKLADLGSPNQHWPDEEARGSPDPWAGSSLHAVRSQLVLLNRAQGLQEGHARGQGGRPPVSAGNVGTEKREDCAAETVDSTGTRSEIPPRNTPNSEPAPTGRAAEAPACLPLRSPPLSQSEAAERVPRSPWGRCPRPEGQGQLALWGGSSEGSQEQSRGEARAENCSKA